MNKAIIMGRLTRNPEVRTTQAGKVVTSFTLAVDRIGSKEADFIPLIAWEKLGENAGNYLNKGQKCLVEGRIQTRSYDGKDGVKRYVTEIIAQNIEFLERSESHSKPDDAASQFGQDVAPDSEIPF